jgi:glycerophosphoryl diester phosphodiesterase
MSRPFLWAHRGASAWAPENTFAAFSAAVECGVDGIELDIHLARDGVPVVIHDETLERTTDGRGPVAWMTSQQLLRLDAGSWFSSGFAGESIPTLEETLEKFGDQLRLNLELKEFDAGMAVLEILGRYPSADIVVSSFNCNLLRRLRSVDMGLPMAVLHDSGCWRRAILLAKELFACSFHPELHTVNRQMVAACTLAGLPVHVWSVDSAPLARSLARAGVSGLFANDPAALADAFFSSAARV